MKDINKDIENLEEIINLINKELDKKDKNVSAILDLKDLLSLRNLIKAYKELKEENEKLRSDNLEYQRTQDIIEAKEANRQLSIELQKKDKIIDLMAEKFEDLKIAYFKKEDGGEFMGKYRTYNKNDWKQYFKEKVENEN